MSSLARHLVRSCLLASLFLVIVLSLRVPAQEIALAQGNAPTQENAPAEAAAIPVEFVTEPLVFIYHLTARDGMVFWGSPGCGGELSPPYPFVRSKPAADGRGRQSRPGNAAVARIPLTVL